MKRILASLIILALLLTGCTSVSDPKATTSDTTASTGVVKVNGTALDKVVAGELKYFPTIDPQYKTARNDVFDFWFDIPFNWKAVDRSETGEEFTILCDNDKVAIIVYGAPVKGSEDDYYTKLAGTGGSIEDFNFRDGWTGKKIINGSKQYYVRADGDSYIILYANSKEESAWFEENKDVIENMGQSLRIRQESYGTISGDDSITLEDLQLGDIKLDMPYEEVLKLMKTKPEKEEEDEYEGMQAKTLFFKDGAEIYIVDGTVYSVNVNSPNYPTPRGLKVGDSVSRLKELYGEPDNKSDSTHWGYNYDGYELFSIVLKNNKVAEIQIDLAM